MSKITLKKFEGISKKTNKPFQAYQLVVGHFSTLIFPRSEIERDYLDNFLKDEAHAEFLDEN